MVFFATGKWPQILTSTSLPEALDQKQGRLYRLQDTVWLKRCFLFYLNKYPQLLLFVWGINICGAVCTLSVGHGGRADVRTGRRSATLLFHQHEQSRFQMVPPLASKQHKALKVCKTLFKPGELFKSVCNPTIWGLVVVDLFKQLNQNHMEYGED